MQGKSVSWDIRAPSHHSKLEQELFPGFSCGTVLASLSGINNGSDHSVKALGKTQTSLASFLSEHILWLRKGTV